MSDSYHVNSRDARCPSWMPWVVCLSAGLFFLYEFFQLNLFDVINQPLREHFNINAEQLGWMSSTFLWANVLFLLPAGVIVDRFSIRRVILFALTSCVLGTFGFSLTHSFAWAAFFHAVTGMGNAFCFLSCMVLVSQWFAPPKRALVMGCIFTMAFLGGMLAHTPFAYLSNYYGWHKALLIDAGMGVLILGWIFIVVKDKPDSDVLTSTPPVNEGFFAGFLRALANCQNWFAGLYASCLNLPIMVLCALWGASYLIEVHKLTEIAASNVVSLIFMGSIIGCPLVGWLSDWMGRRKPLMVAGAIATLLNIVPLFTEMALSETMLGLIFFALGLFTSTQVIAYPVIAESNRLDHTGVATGLGSVIIMGGGAVGQILFGFLMKQHATTAEQHYNIADFQFAMWIFPITAIIALVAVILTRETYCASLEQE